MGRHNKISVAETSDIRSTKSERLKIAGKKTLKRGTGALAIAGVLSTGGAFTSTTVASKHPSIMEKGPYLTSVCDPAGDWLQESLKQQAADSCLEARSGRVALVSFGDYSPELLEDIAKRSEDIANNAMDGLLNVDIVPVVASPEAKAEFSKDAPFCVDVSKHDLRDYSARTAEETMGLEGYVEIVTLLDKPACNPTYAATTFENGSKYIEMYENVMDPDLNTDFYRHGAAFNIAHELGHGLLQFSHDAALTLTNPVNFTPDKWSTRLPDGQSIAFDIQALMQNSTYSSYSRQQNIMGGPTDTKDIYLNSLQRHMMQWPERVKGVDSTRMIPVVPGQTAELVSPTIDKREFAFINLQAAFYFGDNIRGRSPNYTNIAFDPVITDEGAQPGVMNIYLVSEDWKSTLDIGTASLPLDRDMQEVLYIHDKRIATSFHDGKFRITVDYRDFGDPFMPTPPQYPAVATAPR